MKKCFDVSALHACMRALHKLSLCPIRITSYCEQCAESNADVIGAATAYELIFDTCFVICVGIVVPVQEIRRATMVASIRMCHV